MMLNQVCFRTKQYSDPAKLVTYQQIGGYSTWSKILSKEITKDYIIEQIKGSKFCGRGGAGFPLGDKLIAVENKQSDQKYVICNAHEGEPGTYKDRELIQCNPHQIIEGIAIAAYTVGAKEAYIYICSNFTEQLAIMKQAIAEVQQEDLLRQELQIHCFSGMNAYICGEETALLASMEGKLAQANIKPPYPVECGLYAKPTLINNVETFASIPVILEKGANWYRENSTKIFSVTGAVNKPNNYEVPLGIKFSELLALAGGMKDGKQLKAVIPGGLSTPILPASIIYDLPMDYINLKKVGSSLGTGGVIVFANDDCMVTELSKILEFYWKNSCGKCTPCREGSGWLYRVMLRILNDKAQITDLYLLSEISAKIGTNSLCGLGDSIPIVVTAFLRHFADEFKEYIIKKKGKNKK